MPIELTATTEPGARLVADAERLADEFATRAAHHDRDVELSVREHRRAPRGAATSQPQCPWSSAGRGVTSVHDLVVAASRLARGDASVAIGVNMHIGRRAEPHAPLAGRRRAPATSGGPRRSAATLEAVAHDRAVIATAVSEPGRT